MPFPSTGWISLLLTSVAGFGALSPHPDPSHSFRAEKRTVSEQLDCVPRFHADSGSVATRRNARSRDVVVPSGAASLVVCRYRGLPASGDHSDIAKTGKLIRERRSSNSKFVSSVAKQFDRSRPAERTYYCPNSNGASIYTVFQYHSQPDVIVETELSGCRFSFNGFRVGGFTSPSLLHRLESFAAVQ